MGSILRAVHSFPVSVKGVAIQGGKVLLLENERAEWELPGGKLELGEEPAECVAREITEETGWHVSTGPLLDCWQYHIRPGADVLIVTYGCHVLSSDPPVVSTEHRRAGLFTQSRVPGLHMPDGYKRSVATWFARADVGQGSPSAGDDPQIGLPADQDGAGEVRRPGLPRFVPDNAFSFERTGVTALLPRRSPGERTAPAG